MAFACEEVVREPGTPVSFKNVMDGVGAADFPAPTTRWFAIFCFFSQVPMTVTNCRVVIADERGEVVAQKALKDLTFTAESQISRSVVGFQGFSWPYPGRYLIEFVANRDDVMAAFPMRVEHVPPDGELLEAPPA